MRLIDADALFNWNGKKLSDAVKYGNKDSEQQSFSYSTLMMYEIADEIDDAPTIESVKRGEWISVEDRLPENPRTVITAHCYNSSGIPTAVGTARYHSDTGKWISEIGLDDTNEITHWMSMPAPPESRENDV